MDRGWREISNLAENFPGLGFVERGGGGGGGGGCHGCRAWGTNELGF